VGELLDPQIDWKEQLREFVQSTCSAKDVSSWRKINRRLIGQDLYMPSLIGESIRKMVVGADTSGSIADELPVFISEVRAMAQEVRPEELIMIYWDSRVVSVERYDMSDIDQFEHNTQPKGGGGTAPKCVSTYLKNEGIIPECIIMMTDGYVGNDWGHDWTAPLLWVVAGNPEAEATTGKTIHVNT
jgi:predicted metal-dependent peptidase